MATQSYADWIFHFLHGLKNNTDEKILVNLINFDEDQVKFLEKNFKGVIFVNHEKDLVPKENHNFNNNVFKVTYLKGQFIYDAYQKYQEPILWIDVTALIRSDLGELFSKLENKVALLTRRDFSNDFGKGVYAAEIFGLNDKKEIKRYYKNCEERKDEWFSDQFALCEIEGTRDYIPFGEWINFYYGKDAKSWSDRGKSGKGKLQADDDLYSQNKYIEDLETKFENYEEDFNRYKLKFRKPKILIHVDANDWCYCNTVNEIIKNPNFEFTVIYNAVKQSAEVKNWQGDLVWGRCGSYRHKKIYQIRPDLKAISFSTVTTGGDLLLNRFDKQVANNEGEAGVIVQNESAKFLVDSWIKEKENQMECFILPNGVNCDRFKQKDHSDSEDYVLGFVGRTRESSERELKGYYFAKRSAEIEGLKFKVASNTPDTEVKFEDMPEFYQSIDALILPSTSEGCSNTINEAMASGLPVITPKRAYHGENCRDEVYFISRDIKCIVEALKQLRDASERRNLGKKARKWAEKHSWTKMHKYYTEIFNQMIEVANKNKLRSPTQSEPEIINKNIPNERYFSVRALKKVRLGKVERSGPTIWFEQGMVRKIKDTPEYRSIIERAVKDKQLEII